jgi:hypothetical protein
VRYAFGNVLVGFIRLQKVKSGKLLAMMKISTLTAGFVREVQEELGCIMTKTV